MTSNIKIKEFIAHLRRHAIIYFERRRKYFADWHGDEVSNVVACPVLHFKKNFSTARFQNEEI